jgi:hypothetical protein
MYKSELREPRSACSNGGTWNAANPPCLNPGSVAEFVMLAQVHGAKIEIGEGPQPPREGPVQ